VEEVFSFSNNIAFPEYPEADCVVTTMKFKNGAIGKVMTAFGAQQPMSHPIRVFGSEATVENNLLFNKHGVEEIILPVRGRKTDRILLNGLARIMKKEVFRYPFQTYPHGIAVKKSLMNFVEAVRSNTKPLIDVYEGSKTIAVCVAAITSYRENRVVKLEEVEYSRI